MRRTNGGIQVGAVAAGETSALYRCSIERPGRKLCYLLHGANQSVEDLVSDRNGAGAYYGIVELNRRGYDVLALLGLDKFNFGNDAAQATYESARSWAAARGLAINNACGMGFSMGNISGLNWWRTRPDRMKAWAGGIPALNMLQIHDDNVLGTQPYADAAYGGSAGFYAAQPTHDPFAQAEQYAGRWVRFWTSSDDPAALGTYVTQFISRANGVGAGANASQSSFGAVGHSIVGFPWTSVANFLDAHLS